MKKFFAVLSALFLVIALTACYASTTETVTGVTRVQNSNTNWAIALNGASIIADGTGVAVDGGIATIFAAGTYSLSGSLAQITMH